MFLIILGVVQTRRGPITLPKTAEATSKILLLFNDVFDSFNGKKGQGLSSILTANSGHIEFWKEACKQLRHMEYVDKTTRQIKKTNGPKCIKNWIWTIEAVQEIWNVVQKAQFQFLNLKYLNQDCVENFFSQIRNVGGCSNNPNPQQFQDAFKTLLICNITSTHSVGANCTEDEGASLALSDFMKFEEVARNIATVEEMPTVECTEAAVPIITTSEIIIDPKTTINLIRHNTIIENCQECTDNLDNAQVVQYI